MNDNEIDIDEDNDLVKVYEEHKKNKKKVKCFVELKLMVFSDNNIFGKNNFIFNIYH